MNDGDSWMPLSRTIQSTIELKLKVGKYIKSKLVEESIGSWTLGQRSLLLMEIFLDRGPKNGV